MPVTFNRSNRRDDRWALGDLVPSNVVLFFPTGVQVQPCPSGFQDSLRQLVDIQAFDIRTNGSYAADWHASEYGASGDTLYVRFDVNSNMNELSRSVLHIVSRIANGHRLPAPFQRSLIVSFGRIARRDPSDDERYTRRDIQAEVAKAKAQNSFKGRRAKPSEPQPMSRMEILLDEDDF